MSFVIPFAFFDPPQVVDASITPIPASSALPLQVIADIGNNLGKGVNYSDTTGEFIGVYVGVAGQEVLVCIIGNGLTDQGWGTLPPRSRVCLRAMQNVAITNGKITCQIVTV